MTYVVSGRCVDCRYTYCVVECPVDCFWELAKPRMLVIDPITCIHCDACVPLCPVNAIWSEDELPPEYAEWKAFNEQHFAEGTNVKEGQEPLDTARLLEEIQADEQKRGLAITEPTGAS